VHLEVSSVAPFTENSSLVSVMRRTHRHDPLDEFKCYGGGWNIANDHYWASVGLTDAPYFAIVSLWFIGFGLVLLALLCYRCCCKWRVKLAKFHEEACSYHTTQHTSHHIAECPQEGAHNTQPSVQAPLAATKSQSHGQGGRNQSPS